MLNEMYLTFTLSKIKIGREWKEGNESDVCCLLSLFFLYILRGLHSNRTKEEEEKNSKPHKMNLLTVVQHYDELIF